jgi:hypothetical protein
MPVSQETKNQLVGML